MTYMGTEYKIPTAKSDHYIIILYIWVKNRVEEYTVPFSYQSHLYEKAFLKFLSPLLEQ